jgi:two-component system sensor histidine kinase YesM
VFKFRSLSVKMTVYFSTLITLVLLIVGMITYYKSSKLIEDGVIQISGEVLKKMTTNIDYYFRDAESLSKGIAIDGLIQNLLIRNSAKNDMIYDEILRSVKDKLSNYANTRVNITRIMVVNDK